MKMNDKPTVTSLIISGKRRLVYVYPDGKQMIQQYDMKTHEILTRKIKKQSHFKESKWEYELGEVEDKGSAQTIMKSNNAPIFIRKDTLECFQWRIRNLPFSEETYLLEVDSEKQEIVIKTTIKKYYKRFDVPDLKRMNIKLDKALLSFSYKNNTLVVSYKKPELLLEKELALRKEFQKMNAKKPKQGDMECTTQ